MKLNKYYVLGVVTLVVLSIYYVYQNSLKSANNNPILFENNENIDSDEISNEDAKSVYIDIAGAVKNPGVYSLSEDSIVNDVILIAGGFSSEYDKKAVEQKINLAQRIVDGQKIYIPYEGENIDFSNISTQVSNNATSLININTASLAELETLPSVGQVTAQAIIEARPYKKIEDLMNVKGIGETTFSKLKDKICV